MSAIWRRLSVIVSALLLLTMSLPGSGLAATSNVTVSAYVNQSSLVTQANAWTYISVRSIYLRLYLDGLLKATKTSYSTSAAIYKTFDATLLANGTHQVKAMGTFYPTYGTSFTLTSIKNVLINNPPAVTITDPGSVGDTFDISGTVSFFPCLAGGDLGTLYVDLNNPNVACPAVTVWLTRAPARTGPGRSCPDGCSMPTNCL